MPVQQGDEAAVVHRGGAEKVLEERVTAGGVLGIVARASGLDEGLIRSKIRVQAVAVARGMYFVLGRKLDFGTAELAAEVGRTRTTGIQVMKTYTGMMEVRDPLAVELMERIYKEISTM